MSKPNITIEKSFSIEQTDAIICNGCVFDSTDGELIGNMEDCIVVSWWSRHCEDCDPEQFFRVILKEDLDTFNPND
jgi:hypothetical protein